MQAPAGARWSKSRRLRSLLSRFPEPEPPLPVADEPALPRNLHRPHWKISPNPQQQESEPVEDTRAARGSAARAVVDLSETQPPTPAAVPAPEEPSEPAAIPQDRCPACNTRGYPTGIGLPAVWQRGQPGRPVLRHLWKTVGRVIFSGESFNAKPGVPVPRQPELIRRQSPAAQDPKRYAPVRGSTTRFLLSPRETGSTNAHPSAGNRR